MEAIRTSRMKGPDYGEPKRGLILAIRAKKSLSKTIVNLYTLRFVDVSADLTILFPSVVPKALVTQTGVAKLRAFTH